MILEKSPERWANDLSIVLRKVLGDDRFPIKVSELALEYTKQVFPDGPITKVLERDFQGFEGALIPRADGSGEWGIGVSSKISSKGRQNFTLAHEFGHYLLHRLKYPNGLKCRPEDMAVWDSEYNLVEGEANRFAASLLMPLDDFREQLPVGRNACLNELGLCAKRYGVSLMAATLRWLSYTEKRAVLAVTREGYILWARSSHPAFKSGAFIKTVGRPPVAVPRASPLVRRASVVGMAPALEHGAGVWLREPVVEHAIISERYDLGLSLLVLENSSPKFSAIGEEERDLVDQLSQPSF